VASALAPRRAISGWCIGLLGGLALVLAGCGSTGWKAPTETRASGRTITGPTYQVRAGDTLQVIAARAGIEQVRIVEWNQLASPDRIYAGQVLRLTAPRDGEARAPSPSPGTVPPPEVAPSAQPRPAYTSPRSTEAAPVERLRWQWPTGGRVVARFSADDPNRKGVKIAGRAGQPIVAAEGGSVVYSGSGLVGYGQLIIVKHNNNYLSAYGHNRKLLVQQGDPVARGAQIAEMGLAGGAPVLHFEIRRDGDPVDPLALLPRR
jgi:lipoprotein NlpD